MSSSRYQIIERAIATHPDGIAVDLLDAAANKPVLEEAQQAGVKVVAWIRAPGGHDLHIDRKRFYAQAELASERLVKLLNGKGNVAIMQKVSRPRRPKIRYECHKKVFAKYPDIKVVAEGIDNDDIETAQKQAAEIMQAHPDLNGWGGLRRLGAARHRAGDQGGWQGGQDLRGWPRQPE